MKQQRTKEPQQESIPIIDAVDDETIFTNLSASLTEIRKLKGVVGYILRSNTAAVIDLPFQEQLTEYAMLSSQVFEYSGGVVEEFKLTDVESILVEGSKLKLLCMRMGENKVSVFMDKTCAHTWIVKRIHL